MNNSTLHIRVTFLAVLDKILNDDYYLMECNVVQKLHEHVRVIHCCTLLSATLLLVLPSTLKADIVSAPPPLSAARTSGPRGIPIFDVNTMLQYARLHSRVHLSFKPQFQMCSFSFEQNFNK
jgi:hypothetical protein